MTEKHSAESKKDLTMTKASSASSGDKNEEFYKEIISRFLEGKRNEDYNKEIMDELVQFNNEKDKMMARWEQLEIQIQSLE